MASILDLLRKKDPNMSLEDARAAMGLGSKDQFNFLGEQVPDQEPESALPPPSMAPLQVQVPQEPQIMRPGRELGSDLDIESNPVIRDDKNNDISTELAMHPTPVTKPIKAAVIQKKQEKVPEPKKEVVEEEPKKEEADIYKGEDEVAHKYAQDQELDAVQKALASDELLQAKPRQPSLAEKFQEAQDRQRKIEDRLMYAKIGAQLGGAISGQSDSAVKSNVSLVDSMAPMAGQDMRALQGEIAFQKQDPNSEYSKAARQVLKDTVGLDLPEGITAEQMDNTFEKLGINKASRDAAIQKALITKEMKEKELEERNRHNTEAEKAAYIRANSYDKRTNVLSQMNKIKEKQAEVINSYRNDRLAQSAIDKVNRQVYNPVIPADKQNLSRLMQAENMFLTAGIDPTTMNDEKDVEKLDKDKLNSLPKQMVVEMAMEGAKMLTGTGSPAKATIDKLIPNNRNMDVAGILSYITNNLEPAKQQDAMKAYLKLATRAKIASLHHEETRLQPIFKTMGHMPGLPAEYQDTLKKEVNLKYGFKPKTVAPSESKEVQKSVSPVEGKIKVKKGSEVLLIDKNDLDHAKADGYEEVK